MIIQELNQGQLVVTIPRKLALATGLQKGTKVDFVINTKGRLEMVKE